MDDYLHLRSLLHVTELERAELRALCELMHGVTCIDPEIPANSSKSSAKYKDKQGQFDSLLGVRPFLATMDELDRFPLVLVANVGGNEREREIAFALLDLHSNTEARPCLRVRRTDDEARAEFLRMETKDEMAAHRQSVSSWAFTLTDSCAFFLPFSKKVWKYSSPFSSSFVDSSGT